MAHATYLDYQEYQEHGGDLAESAFPLAEFKARKVIDYWTDCRVQDMAEVPEAVKMCMMYIIKHDSKFGSDALADSPRVASFNTDGYSENYGSVSEQAESAERSLHNAIRALLYGETDDKGTPLLYRGVCG